MPLEEDYSFQCPHCWADISIRVDTTGGDKQTFSHDCEVCCKPVRVTVKFSAGEITEFSAQPES